VAGVSASTARKVGLLSSHAFFLTKFQQLLADGGLKAELCRLDTEVLGNFRAGELPHCSVYVLDFAPTPQLTNMLVTNILTVHPHAPILVTAETVTEKRAFPLLRLGVRGLLSYAEAEQLPRAVNAISAGGYWVPRTLLARFVDEILEQTRSGGRKLPHPTYRVSQREQQILDSLLENRSNKEIAQTLNISERTVKFHVSNLLAKYGVQRRADLILLSFQSGA
jgi:DNA-binding NarL/FixJ family response regulator